MSRDQQGRLLTLDGHLFYSPNSNRTVSSLPARHIQSDGRDIFPFLPGVTWDKLCDPCWWTPSYGWTSFIPIDREFKSPLLDALVHIPALKKLRDTRLEVFGMPRSVVATWDELGSRLCDVSEALVAQYGVPAKLPYVPSDWGYGRTFPNHRKLLALVNHSRTWFLVWMGLVSFLVAHAETEDREVEKRMMHQGGGDRFRSWKELIVSKCGLDETWVNETLGGNPLCTFPTTALRSGLFLDITKKSDPTQPSPMWFLQHGIPIWYPWNSEVAEYIFRRPELAPLVASDFLLQEITVILTKTLPSSSMNASGSNLFYVGDETQVDFERKNRHDEIRRIIREYESEEARLYRREKPSPLAAMAVVYHTNYDSPSHLIRTVVEADQRDETLWYYAEHQKLYFPHLGLWVCCYDMAPGDELGPSDNGNFEEGPSSVPDTRAVFPPDRFAEGSSSLINDVHDVLCWHYGFIYPPSRPPSAVSTTFNQVERSILLRRLGFPLPYPGEDEFFASEFPFYANEFLDSYMSRSDEGIQDGDQDHHARSHSISRQESYQGPSKVSSDLSPDNPASLLNNALVYTITVCGRVPDKASEDPEKQLSKPKYTHLPTLWFIFHFDSLPYRFAVTSAAHALIVCRLGFGPVAKRPAEIIKYFIENGIPFQTFSPMHSQITRPTQDPNIPSTLPVRPVGHDFTLDDYRSYVRMRDLMLADPRIRRAAVMRGNILWRLAIGRDSVQGVLQGPSGYTGVEITDPITSESLVDDDLSYLEVQLLCGTYICHIDAHRFVLKSWWPIPNITANGREDYGGRWSAYREKWFRSRLEVLSTGAEPHGLHKWSSFSRGRREIGIFHMNYESAARSFLKDNCASIARCL